MDVPGSNQKHGRSVPPSEDDTSLVVVVVDCSVAAWGSAAAPAASASSAAIDLGDVWNAVVGFAGAVLMLSPLNEVAIFGAWERGADILFPATPASPDPDLAARESAAAKTSLAAHADPAGPDGGGGGSGGADGDGNGAESTAAIAPTTTTRDELASVTMANVAALYAIRDREAAEDGDGESSSALAPPTSPGARLSGALARALCYTRRRVAGSPRHRPRLLVLGAAADVSEQYIAVMNAMFASAKEHIPVDVCMVRETPSLFLQHAVHLTGGAYAEVSGRDQLLQTLLSVFAVDLYGRQHLRMPTLTAIDFRATCFCHQNTIDVGYCCSVCLSVFCEPHSECSTCGTVFPPPTDD